MNRRSPVVKPRLVGMRNDGRIEQGRGFQRVFAGEERAEEEPARFGKARALCLICPRDFLEMTQPDFDRGAMCRPLKSAPHERELSL